MNSTLTRKAEITKKLSRLRELMQKESLQAVALAHHANFSWLTAGGKSVVTISNEDGVATLLITHDKAYAITNNIEEGRLRDEELLEELGFELIVQPWYQEDTLKLVESLAGCDASKIGSDRSLGSAKVIPGKINSLKYSLLPSEMERYLHLGTVLSTVLEDFMTTVKPGMTELEITGKLCEALWPHDIDQILFLVSADERAYKYRHGIPTEKKLEKHLNVSVNGRYKGFITTITRMVHFGEVSREMGAQFEKTVMIENRAIAATVVGKDELVPYEACKQAYRDLGYEDMWGKHSQGGPLGYSNRYYSITPTNHGVIHDNQAYCYNAVIDGTKSEDAFIATKNGPVFITKPISYPIVREELDGLVFERPGLLSIR